MGSIGRVYIQESSPSAKKFFDRSASLGFTPRSLVDSSVIDVIGTCTIRYADSEPSSIGFVWYPALSRFRCSNASSLISSVEPGGMSLMFALSAAGFIATRMFGASPGVRMSWSEMCTWNDDTPAIVPAGARISAGKSGRVARSFPNAALTSVNRSPASCMPSPESPANLMTTRFSVSGREVDVVSAVTACLPLPPHRWGGVGFPYAQSYFRDRSALERRHAAALSAHLVQ